MQGFFTAKQTESMSRPDGKTLTCHSCGLYNDCTSARMKPQGNFKLGILNITGQPQLQDDKTGKLHSSQSGKFLQKAYRKLGIDLFEDCLNTTSLLCYSDKPPTTHQLDCCRRFLLKTIQESAPKIIVLFGNLPLQSIIGHRWKRELGSIQKWRGWQIPDQDFKCWICPVSDPVYVMNSFGQYDSVTAENTVWMNDLKQVVKLVV